MYTFNETLYCSSLNRKVRFLQRLPNGKEARVKYRLREADSLPANKEPRSATEEDIVFTVVPLSDLSVPQQHYAEGSTQPENL